MAERKQAALTGDGQTLLNTQDKAYKELIRMLDAMEAAGMEKCKYTYEYDIKLRQAIAYERDHGTAAANTNKMAAGQKEVAELGRKAEEAKVRYEVLPKRIDAVSKLITVLDGRIAREWGKR